MKILSNILKTANRILIAQSQRDYKNFLRQKLLKENHNLDELQLSTKIGQLCKEVKEKLRNIKSNYYQYVYKWLIQGGLPEDIDIKFKPYLQQYQYIKNNNKENIQINKNILDSFQNLYDFIENYNKNHQPLNISVEKQKARKQDLPFEHIASNGNYNMYIVEDGQYQDFNRLYGNNNNSQYGGLIATTSWCVTLNKSRFKGTYQPPYYLITNGKTAPEALVHIGSKQFKNIKDKPYQYDHKQVYQLVSNLLDKNNAKTYEGDFAVLIRFLPDQQKQLIINELFDKKQFYTLLNYITKGYLPNTLTDWQKQKCINFFVDKIQFEKLFDYIEEGYLPTLSDQQKQKCINNLIYKGWFYNLFDYIEVGYLPPLSDQQNKKCINFFIDENKFDDLFSYIKEGILPPLTDQLKQYCINKLIDKTMFEKLFFYIEKGSLPPLSDQQKQQMIKELIDKNKFNTLLTYITKGILPNTLTDQQKQKYINQLIDENNFYTLFYYIKGGYLPALSDQQKQQMIKELIDKNDFNYLFDYIEEGYLPPLSDQQKEKCINELIQRIQEVHYRAYKLVDLFNYIEKGYLPNTLTDQQYKKIVKSYFQSSIFSDQYINNSRDKIEQLIFNISSEQQKQWIIQCLIQKKLFRALFKYIEKGYLQNTLTDQQKERIRKIDPYIKISNKKANVSTTLVKIARILKD